MLPRSLGMQLLLGLAYSATFPLTNMIGGAVASIGIALTIPFLPVAWIGGVYFTELTGSEKNYLIGAFITVVLQVWLVVLLRSWKRSRLVEGGGGDDQHH